MFAGDLEAGGRLADLDVIFGMRQTRQPERAGLFAVIDYAVGKVAVDLAARRGDNETVATGAPDLSVGGRIPTRSFGTFGSYRI